MGNETKASDEKLTKNIPENTSPFEDDLQKEEHWKVLSTKNASVTTISTRALAGTIFSAELGNVKPCLCGGAKSIK